MKKLISILLLSALALSGCGKKVAKIEGDDVTIVIGATATPHAIILENAKPDLAERGINLEIKEFTSYELLNRAVADGEIDANFFQHEPYLLNDVETLKLPLVSIGKVHNEPMGIYTKQITSLDAIPDGAKISIPNDSTNGGRALLLLESKGIIKLKEGVGIKATIFDIVENSHNVEIQEVAAEMLPRTLEDVTLSVINSNYAMDAGFKPAIDAIAIEDSGSPYANIVAIREADKDKPEFQILMEILTGDKVQLFIKSEFQGAVIGESSK